MSVKGRLWGFTFFFNSVLARDRIMKRCSESERETEQEGSHPNVVAGCITSCKNRTAGEYPFTLFLPSEACWLWLPCFQERFMDCMAAEFNLCISTIMWRCHAQPQCSVSQHRIAFLSLEENLQVNSQIFLLFVLYGINTTNCASGRRSWFYLTFQTETAARRIWYFF